VSEQVPEGTVDEVTEWVGDDPKRAAKALKDEQKKDNPRTTLIERLERKAEHDEADEDEAEVDQSEDAEEVDETEEPDDEAEEIAEVEDSGEQPEEEEGK